MTYADSRQIIVLDTNVCLDLFIFRDPRSMAILAALRNGTARAVTREDCRMEWQIVLTYPHLKLEQEVRARVTAEFDSLISCLSAPSPGVAAILPICTDQDDQKFLEVARDARADVLITKDKALLKLAKKTARAGLFSIMQPESWSVETPAPASRR